MDVLKLRSSFRKCYTPYLLLHIFVSSLHSRIVKPCLTLIDKAIDGHFVIPNFPEFTLQIDSIYSSCSELKDGKVCHVCLCAVI